MPATSASQLPLPSRPRLIVAGILAVCGVVLWQWLGNATRGYIDTASMFYWWGVQWFNPASESEHGPMIVGISLWLLWRNLKQPRNAPDREGTVIMVLAILGGLFLHVLGYFVQQTRISIAAWVLFTWGCFWLAGGRGWGRASLFPLAFLVFAVPVNFLDSAGFHLRMAVVDAAEVLSRWFGIEVVRNGSQLLEPDGSYQYDVAAACSGVRSLVALLALSLVIGYLNLRRTMSRTMVFLLCLPLTYLGNVVRILAIILAAEWWGQKAGEWVHDWAGFVVFLIVLGGVLAASAALARMAVERRKPEATAKPAPVVTPKYEKALVGVLAAMLVLLTGATAGVLAGMARYSHASTAGVVLAEGGVDPVELPILLGADWGGRPTEVTEVEREMLPPDTGYSRKRYVSLTNPRDQVLLSIVLSGRDRTSIHRPELCLVGQGWTIRDQEEHVFTHPNGGEVPATVLLIDREYTDNKGQRRTMKGLYAYWFVGRDEIAATHGRRMWLTAVNRLRGHADRWAYVVAQTTLDDSGGKEAAYVRLQSVLTQALPVFQPAKK